LFGVSQFTLMSSLLRITRSLRCKYSTARTVTLDEMLRHPILERENADPDTLQDLDAFPVPILPRQVSEALRHEFGYPVSTKTDWSQSPKTLEEVRGDWWRAGRLIHETLAIWRNRPGNPVEPEYSSTATCQRPSRGIENPETYSQNALQWIQSECAKMYAEAQSGCTLRYESAELLLPKDLTLTEEHLKYIQPALIAVGKAKDLHPAIKREIIGHICTVIVTSLKK
jgi:hypothetical protein